MKDYLPTDFVFGLSAFVPLKLNLYRIYRFLAHVILVLVVSVLRSFGLEVTIGSSDFRRFDLWHPVSITAIFEAEKGCLDKKFPKQKI